MLMGGRLQFDRLHYVHWVQRDRHDPDQNDMWSSVIAPAVRCVQSSVVSILVLFLLFSFTIITIITPPHRRQHSLRLVRAAFLNLSLPAEYILSTPVVYISRYD